MTNNSFKKKIVLVVFLLMIMTQMVSGQRYRDRTFGEPDKNVAYAVTPAADGNFFVLGDSLTVIMEFWYYVFHHVHLSLIAPDGRTQWTKTYEYQGAATGAAATNDGNYIVTAGSIDTSSFKGNEIHLMKIKPDGDTLWTKTYQWESFRWPDAIAQMPDGNFLIVAGASQLQGAQQEYGVCLLKVNQNGDTLWTKQYFWPEAHRLSAVAPAGDSGFVVAGFADSGQGTQAFLMKIASSGDTVWSRTFSTIPFGITAITPTLDGNFIAAASSASDQSAAACFFKTDSNGNTLWIKTYGGMAGPYTLTQARDGSFIAAGNTVVKISAGGDTVWTIPQKGQMLNTIAIAPYGDGSFITAGAQGPLGDLFLIIDDRYAKKDSLFTFKIPVLGDSLRFTYKAISSPSSMAASPGGTLSWIPGTDSAYVDHVAFVVSDSTITDTLTFNLFVNCRQRPSAIGRPKARLENISSSFRVLDGHFISFFVPGNEAWLEIYDIHGRLTEKLIVENHVAVWRSKNSTGWHCVRIRDFVKPFIVVR